jgi:hypothetical protein
LISVYSNLLPPVIERKPLPLSFALHFFEPNNTILFADARIECCRFVPEKFEEIFARHARTVPDALTSDEIDQLLQANREPGDYSGW